MIIDLHLHEKSYSPDSFQALNDLTIRAKSLGLDAVCVTNHDNDDIIDIIGQGASINGVRVFVGNEVYTDKGDILVFGPRLPKWDRVPLKKLLDLVEEENGATIAAHPYRHNLRGIGDALYEHYDQITAVEAYNASTYPYDNYRARCTADELNLPITGAADSHRLSKLGVYATKFQHPVHTIEDLVSELKKGSYRPVMLSATDYVEI